MSIDPFSQVVFAYWRTSKYQWGNNNNVVIYSVYITKDCNMEIRWEDGFAVLSNVPTPNDPPWYLHVYETEDGHYEWRIHDNEGNWFERLFNQTGQKTPQTNKAAIKGGYSAPEEKPKTIEERMIDCHTFLVALFSHQKEDA